MLCKLLFYAVTPITTVLLPNVAEKKSLGIDTTTVLKKALMYILLYGAAYKNAATYIPTAYFYTVSIVILSIMYSYHTAVSNTKKMTIALFVMSIVMCVLMMLFHDNLSQLLVMIAILLGTTDIYSFKIAKG